ncbi:MAG: SDR family NAD(P)-dependent oxidoreductase [Steroidobacteraceae bacterium]
MTETIKHAAAELTPLKRAFLALEETQARLARAEAVLREPIAIIGLGCRVPGAQDPAAFWQLLSSGTDAISPPPLARFGNIADASILRSAGYLDSVDGFDPAFFGISKREADGIDPQQRLLLEVSWEALESAGLAPDRLERSRTGVYIGIGSSDYNSLQLAAADPALLNAHYASGVAHSVASGRISYVLGLQGPSVSIDTACSSSLVALHLACQALRVGDCRTAIAGGVNLMLSTEPFVAFAESRMLAPDGRSKAFDASADGFGRGEGCCVVVLKRLGDAQADGDTIHAVIRASAVNQDGPSSGLTAPNGPAQEAVIRDALRSAGLAPAAVSYVEAHGTGTQLGDPLEVQALGAVFAPGRDPAHPLHIGAVKTNIGHLEAAAGLASLVKVVLALQNRTIPAHLHFREASPHIPWAQLPFKVPTALTPWEPVDGRRIAGISSFGFSGTNAHVIVEEAPPRPPMLGATRRPAELFTLSARSVEALRVLAARDRGALACAVDADLADVCFTASAGRAQLGERATIAASSVADLRAGLDALAHGDLVESVRCAHVGRRDPPRIAFLFTGQGSQYVGMARELYSMAPAFRAALDRCAAVLDRRLPRPLLAVLHGEAESTRTLDQTAYTQPALFAVEYALAELLGSWGIHPSIVLGHSVGEYTAACVAGALDLESALELIAERGRLMQSLPAGGAMCAVFAEEGEVSVAVRQHAGHMAIAAVNAPGQTVISGAAEPVASIAAEFKARGRRVQPLTVSHAFHSPLVDPILDEFERVAARARFATPRLRLISNIDGQLATAAQLSEPGYWRRHLRSAVRFAESLATLRELKPDLCIEVGPHPALLGFAKMAWGEPAPPLVPTLRRDRPDWRQMLDALAGAHLAGTEIAWRRVFDGQARRVVSLPTYPFERERCWFAARRRTGVSPARTVGPEFLGRRLPTAGSEVIYQFEVSAAAPVYVAEHRVQGRIIVPATCLLESLRSAIDATEGLRGESIESVTLQEALILEDDPDAARTVQVVLGADSGGPRAIKISSIASDGNGEWIDHVLASTGGPTTPSSERTTLEQARRHCAAVVDRVGFYAQFAARGLDFGPAFHSVERICRGADAALVEVRLAEGLVPPSESRGVHPVLLDGCVQAIAAALMGAEDEAALFLPFSVGRYACRTLIGNRCHAYARLRPATGTATRQADVLVFDPDGRLVAELDDLRLKRVQAQALDRLGQRSLDDALYELRWLETTAPGAVTGAAPVALEAVRAGAMQALPALTRAAGLDAYDAFLPTLDRFCLELVVDALRRLGWQPAIGERVSAGALLQQLHILPRHARLLTRLLEILSEGGLLLVDGSHWVLAQSLEGPVTGLERDALIASCPAAAAEVEMTARAGAKFAEALRGEVDPLQLLFPGGTLDTAERLYRDTVPARIFNGLVADAVAALAANATAARPLRILEIGAGTGGTTAHVVPRLRDDAVEYTYTDVGAMFVARARERFADKPFMRFATYDLEKPPQEQGLHLGGYDVILASNVVHATRDLRRTLDRIRALLAPGGTLAMLEVTAPHRWFDLTVGLTEGWWCFEDKDIRPGYATVDRSRWLSLLREAGFTEACAVPASGAGSATLELNTLVLGRVAAASADAQSPTWIVLADEAGVGAELGRRLRARGNRCVTVRRGEAFSLSADAGTVDPRDPDQYRRLLAEVGAAGSPLHGIVHAWCLDRVHTPDEGAADLATESLRIATETMEMARTLARAGIPARLWLLTRGAQAVTPEERGLDPAQTVLFGLARGLGIEHPELRCVCIDLERDAPQRQIDALIAELGEPGAEGQVALRAGRRFASRLLRAEARETALSTLPLNGAWKLTPAERGSLDRFVRVAAGRRAPGHGEVEVEVQATGLNFKDVLNVLGMYPGDAGPLGGECAGVVSAIGEGVAGLRVGEPVMALASGSFASHVTTRAEFVQPRPPRQSAAEAASIPIAFLTAKFCLEHLAQMKRGERVLVHAAAGGVGMAAVRLALRAGAEVFATAGSEWKRELLRGMGVAHVFDSRSTSFADGIRALTQGAGVDIVLNSLSGEMLEASFDVTARGGRFVEIGKRGIKSEADVASMGRELRYFIVDWGDTATRDPALIGRMFCSLAADLRSGALASLPRHAFPIEDVPAAFRFMAQARHAGKIVVTHASAADCSVQPCGTYLVTGGLAGLGPVVARWLAQRGAGRIVLVGRRGPGAEQQALLQELRSAGATVIAEALDVSDAVGLRDLLERLRRDGPPLRGIVHSAGALDDAALIQQDAVRYERVFASKVRGTALLESLTRSDPLDWLVYFSSIAAVFGSPGQTNHSAANAFLDALARDQRLRGLPVSSINWGPWAEVGAAVTHDVSGRLEAQGVSAISPTQGIQALERVVAAHAIQVVVLPVDWPRFRARMRGPQLDAFLAAIAQPRSAARPSPGASAAAAPRGGDLRAQLAQAVPARHRALVAGFVRERALKVLGLDASRAIDPRTPLGELGLDSLLAVELRNVIGSAIGKSLPATLLFDYPTLDTLTDFLLGELGGASSAAAAAADVAAAPADANLVESIEELSDEEVERQLAARAKRKS